MQIILANGRRVDADDLTSDRGFVTIGELAGAGFTLKVDGHLAHPDAPLAVLTVADVIEQVGLTRDDRFTIDEHGEIVDLEALAAANAALVTVDITEPGQVVIGDDGLAGLLAGGAPAVALDELVDVLRDEHGEPVDVPPAGDPVDDPAGGAPEE